MGKASPPSVVGIVFNLLRIPGALLLSSTSLSLRRAFGGQLVFPVFLKA